MVTRRVCRCDNWMSRNGSRNMAGVLNPETTFTDNLRNCYCQEKKIPPQLFSRPREWPSRDSNTLYNTNRGVCLLSVGDNQDFKKKSEDFQYSTTSGEKTGSQQSSVFKNKEETSFQYPSLFKEGNTGPQRLPFFENRGKTGFGQSFFKNKEEPDRLQPPIFNDTNSNGTGLQQSSFFENRGETGPQQLSFLKNEGKTDPQQSFFRNREEPGLQQSFLENGKETGSQKLSFLENRGKTDPQQSLFENRRKTGSQQQSLFRETSGKETDPQPASFFENRKKTGPQQPSVFQNREETGSQQSSVFEDGPKTATNFIEVVENTEKELENDDTRRMITNNTKDFSTSVNQLEPSQYHNSRENGNFPTTVEDFHQDSSYNPQDTTNITYDTHKTTTKSLLPQNRPQVSTNKQINDFRTDHYFETHSTEDLFQTAPDHTCVHSFDLDHRLLPRALHADAYGSSRCVICGKPMENPKVSKIDEREKKNIFPKFYKYGLAPRKIFMGDGDVQMAVKIKSDDIEMKPMKKPNYFDTFALRYQKGVA